MSNQGSENQNNSVADILARMKEAGEWDGDLGFAQNDAAQAPVAPTPAAQTPPVQTPPVQAQPQPELPATESETATQQVDVNSYMSQLMNRYTDEEKGETKDQDTQANDSTGTDDNHEAASDSDETLRLPADQIPTPEMLANVCPSKITQLLKENEYLPSQIAPEKGKNIDALRQLANESARSAVTQHADKEFHFMKMVRIGMTVAAVVAAVALFLVAKSWTDPMMYASMGVALIAMFSGTMVFVTRNANDSSDKKDNQENKVDEKAVDANTQQQ